MILATDIGDGVAVAAIAGSTAAVVIASLYLSAKSAADERRYALERMRLQKGVPDPEPAMPRLTAGQARLVLEAIEILHSLENGVGVSPAAEANPRKIALLRALSNAYAEAIAAKESAE